jgi:voltage-gated potassium channel Kch
MTIPVFVQKMKAPFDNAVSIVKKFGKSALMAKMDIKSAFRLLKCNPGDFDLIGITLEENYYIDKCMPMGCSISCATFEQFSTFLQWAVTHETTTDYLDNYLDGFFFAGEATKNACNFSILSCGILTNNSSESIVRPMYSIFVHGPSLFISDRDP